MMGQVNNSESDHVDQLMNGNSSKIKDKTPTSSVAEDDELKDQEVSRSVRRSQRVATQGHATAPKKISLLRKPTRTYTRRNVKNGQSSSTNDLTESLNQIVNSISSLTNEMRNLKTEVEYLKSKPTENEPMANVRSYLSRAIPDTREQQVERIIVQSCESIKPPNFNGNSEEAYSWLINYKQVAKTNNWSEKVSLNRVYHVFNESARRWLNTAWTMSEPKSWKEFEEEFMRFYLGDNLKSYMKTRLCQLKQGENEKLMNYYLRALQLANLCQDEVPLREQIDCVTKGMLPNIRRQIRLTCPQNFLQLERVVKVYEEEHNMALPKNNSPSNEIETMRKPKEDSWCLNCGQKGHYTRGCSKPFNREAVEKRRSEWAKTKKEIPKPVKVNVVEEEVEAVEDDPCDQESLIFRRPPENIVPPEDLEGFAAIRMKSVYLKRKKKCSRITCKINGQAEEATVDTGATSTVIPFSLVKATDTDLYEWKSVNIHLADGSPVRPLGWCLASIEYLGRTLTVSAIVLEDAPDSLLGEDYLEAAGLTISYADKVVTYYDEYMKWVDNFNKRIAPKYKESCAQTEETLNMEPKVNRVKKSESKGLYVEHWNEDQTVKLNRLVTGEPHRLEVRSRRRVVIPPQSRARLEVKVSGEQNCEKPILIDSKFNGKTYTAAGISRTRATVIQMYNLSKVPQIVERRETITRASLIDQVEITTCTTPNIPSTISEDMKLVAKNLLDKWKRIFITDNKFLGIVPFIEHRIDTGDAEPIRSKPYRVSIAEQKVIENLVKEMEDGDIIRPSRSLWASPVVLVKKKGTTDLRFCVDYRKLNKLTKIDPYPIPNMDTILETLSGSHWFSKLDVKSMYWQVRLDEGSKEKTAFVVHCGQYEFNVMPFGLVSAPMTAMRVMNEVTRNVGNVFVFYDDILVYTSTIEEHMEVLERLFDSLDKANIKLNASKCELLNREVSYLGHIVTPQGIQPDPDKIKGIAKFASPRNVTEARSFIGMCNFFRRFIKGFADIARPIHDVVKNGDRFMWTIEAEQAMLILKDKLMSPPVLVHFDPEGDLTVRCDASGIGLGAVLMQDHPDRNKKGVIAYTSRTLVGAEKNYATTHKECLAVIHAVKQWRHYLYGKHFKIVTDHHALCWLMTVKDHTGQLMRWSLVLQEYEFSITYESGKLHSDADCLSRNPLEIDHDVEHEEVIPTWPVRALRVGATSEEKLKDLILPVFDIPDEQRSDSYCKKIIDAIEGDNKTLKRKYKKFILKDKQLYRKSKLEPNRYILVLPKSMVQFVLTEAHDKPIGGHFGVKRTKETLRQKFYWTSLNDDVDRYVKSCDACQRKKPNSARKQGFMIPMRIPDKPFDILGMDLTGPLPATYRQSEYILVITDYLTKYVIAHPIRKATTEKVMDVLKKYVFYTHGVPKTIITDNGTNLTSHAMRGLLELMKIKHKTTSPYRPQTNGQTERYNRVIGTQLTIFAGRKPKTWDQYLDALVFAYNTTTHSSHLSTPYRLVFGRDPDKPIDRIFESEVQILPNEKHLLIEEDILQEARKLAKTLIEKSQQATKARYDKPRQSPNYKLDDLVLKWKETHRVGERRKFTENWVGPYKIVKRLNDVNYQISNENESIVVHIDQIKPYTSRSDARETCNEMNAHNVGCTQSAC